MNAKEHVHPHSENKYTRATVTVKAKEIATSEHRRAATDIIEQATKDVDHDGIIDPLLRKDYVARVINRFRQDQRPKEPKDLSFELDERVIPEGFYRTEVRVEERRHLIFVTDEQLQVLRQAHRWYIDGTFKVMRKPLNMLLSVHAFVRRGECAKQLPLAFAAMSGKAAADYEAVLRALVGLLQEHDVEEVVVDFEAAIWKSIRTVLPSVNIKGCSFHWGQALWRQIQSLGLSTQYMQDSGTRSTLRMLFCLPFLPSEHIEPTMSALEDLNAAENLKAGWHRRLNIRAGAGPPFYTLVTLLHQEAKEAEVQRQLVGEFALQSLQRKTYRRMQGQIFDAWDSYREKTLSTTGLLKKISTIYRPIV